MRILPFFAMAWGNRMEAADGSTVSVVGAGFTVLAAAAVAGMAVWLIGRRSHRRSAREATQTVEQITSLVEHADCLLWEARVVLVRGTWQWNITLHRSVLYQKLFGGRQIAPDTDLWAIFEVPERAEMERRANAALHESRPGYEQDFRVIRGWGGAMVARKCLHYAQRTESISARRVAD